MTRHTTHSARETFELARTFAATLRPGDVVTLSGTLGSGKTQFVTGICAGLNTAGHATSPTFTIINEYDAPFGKVVHVDLYRISSANELRELGIEEYFSASCICLIEWPEVLGGMLPVHYRIEFEHGSSESERHITIYEPVPA